MEHMESMDDYMEEIDKSFRKIHEGDMVTGTIIDINEDEVTLDLKYYTQGVIPMAEVSDDPNFKAMEDLKIGDDISATVTTLDDGRGNIGLSRKEANDILAWDKLKEYLESEAKVSVKVSQAVNGGVVTYLEGIRAFIPASQLSTTYVEDLESWVGKQLEAVVITADEAKNKLVLSSRAVEKEKEVEATSKKMAMIVPGSVFEGTVESLMPYGAFVSIGNGLTGLVHISKICQKRIKKPSEVLEVGQKVKVKVVEVKDGKISLSMRDFEEAMEDIETDVIEEFDYVCEEEEGVTAFGALLANIKLDN